MTLTTDDTMSVPMPPLDRHRVDPTNARTWRGLGPADSLILSRHLDLALFTPDVLLMHVPVGTVPAGLSLDVLDRIGVKAAQLYLKRIDAVAFERNAWHVIELKPAAGYVALGQAIVYTRLFQAAYPQVEDPTPTVMTDAPDPDLAELWEIHQITVRRLPGTSYTPTTYPT